MSSHRLILAVVMSAVAVGVIRSPWAPTASIEVEPPMVSTADMPLIGSTTVEVTNALQGEQVSLEVHCKDKNTDFGAHELLSGGTYSLSVEANPGADYLCEFVFDKVVHRFDIYLFQRDHNRCVGNICKWFVYREGICSPEPHCYSWN